MSRTQYIVAILLALACWVLLALDVFLLQGNHTLQQQISARQQYVQQSTQLEGLYREIVRALAELAARSDDEAVRTMLARHGITYTVNAPATPAPAPETPVDDPEKASAAAAKPTKARQ